MKKYFESLREHTMKIISSKQKKMKLLKNKQQESYGNVKICYTCKERDKKYRKVKDHCHYTGEYRYAAQSICNLKYFVFKKTPLVFDNGSIIIILL